VHVHLVDGTYELFRHFFAMPSEKNEAGVEVAAVRGVVASMRILVAGGATHVGYKTSNGVPPELLAQFPLLEDALRAAGFVVWPMVEFEADDALAAAAAAAVEDTRVERVIICTPDKDLAQCVRGTRVVLLNRRARLVLDADAVTAKFGVPPTSIPDYLALVGDAADGYPGLPGWGAKSTATVLARYHHLEHIPDNAGHWDVRVTRASELAATLSKQRVQALLFRTLATLRTDVPLFEDVEELRYAAPDRPLSS
jgi:5'-3' exonuclease